MKFKKIMLITLLLLAVLTIGAASAADDVDALAVDDVGYEAIAEAPVDDASLEAEENVDSLGDSAENFIEFRSDNITSNDDIVAEIADSSYTLGSRVSVFANGTTVYDEDYDGYVLDLKGSDFKGRYDGNYNITVLFNKGGSIYSLSKIIYFDNIYNADFSDLKASDFNVTFKNTELNLRSDSDSVVFSFFYPEGLPDGYINIKWGEGASDYHDLYSTFFDTNVYINVTLGNLGLKKEGIYNVTISFCDFDDNVLELAKSTLNLTNVYVAEDFIELYKENCYAPEDEIIWVHDLQGSKLDGLVTVYYNDAVAFKYLAYGERASLFIAGNDLTGVFNGTCNLTVVYERNADGKKYSKDLTVNFVNPIVNKPLAPEDFNVTFPNKEVEIQDENKVILRYFCPEGIDEYYASLKLRYGSGTYDYTNIDLGTGDINKTKEFTFGNLYLFETGTYNLTVSYYVGQTCMLEIANSTLKVTKTYTPNDFIELYTKTLSSPTDYVCNVYDSYGTGLKGQVSVLANGTSVYEYAGTGTLQAIRINGNNLTGNLKGTYNIKVIYNRTADGKEYYKEAVVTFPNSSPTPTYQNSSISASDVTIDYGSTTDVNVTTQGATGITAKIDGADAAVTGNRIAVPVLDAGKHTLSITTIPDTNYLAVTKNVTITVNHVDSSVNVNDVVVDYGNSTNVTVETEGATGFTAAIDGVTAEVKDGAVIIPVLDVGTHILSVTTIADANHNQVTKNATITVNKVDSSVIVPDITFDYGSSGTSNVVGLTNISANVNSEKAIVDVNGNVITVSGLDAGTYTLTVKGLDSNNENVTKAATVTVNKLKSSIAFNVSSIVFDYGASGSVKADVSNGVIGKVGVVDHAEAVIAVNGSVITVSNLTPGSYVLSVSTNPDSNYDAATENVTVTVNKLATSVSASKISVAYGASKNIVVTLKDSNGNPIANKKVSIKFNNVAYSGTTNSEGKASIAITKTAVTVKTYASTITFAGDDTYAKSTGTVNVVVTKATPKLTAKAKTFKKSDKTKKYTITLKNNLNKVMKNTKVTIKVNKKTYTAKTNSKGVATFKFTKLTKKGKYTATVKYAGSKYYNAKTVKPKITVK